MEHTRQQFIADVTITAIEGGINYWARVDKYRHHDGKGPVTATIADLESEDVNGFDITPDVIERGIDRLRPIAAYRGGYWAQFWSAEATNGEYGDYDAEIADVIVQFAVLGELVYA